MEAGDRVAKKDGLKKAKKKRITHLVVMMVSQPNGTGVTVDHIAPAKSYEQAMKIIANDFAEGKGDPTQDPFWCEVFEVGDQVYESRRYPKFEKRGKEWIPVETV